MKIGIITYTSLYCNFTNYGTVLQAWAMKQTLEKMGEEPILIDYCPDSMMDKNPLSPFENMWDTDPEVRKLAERTLPAIKSNLEKITEFYKDAFTLTKGKYLSNNIQNIADIEGISRFVVGSDSIWDIDEFGFDDVFFANTSNMRWHSIAYAPSFQDSISDYGKEDFCKLNIMLGNFLSIGVRDRHIASYIKEATGGYVPVVLDPTLLLDVDEYKPIEASNVLGYGKYILYYSRRYNSAMETFVDRIAEEKKLNVVEISLRADNVDKHFMRYDAGVEEFLTLVKNAEMVITNSFHCMIFAIQYRRDFYVFSRQHCHGKIMELLDILGLTERFLTDNKMALSLQGIDYDNVQSCISEERMKSLAYLEQALNMLRS